jgi:hypothetical protein
MLCTSRRSTVYRSGSGHGVEGVRDVRMPFHTLVLCKNVSSFVAIIWSASSLRLQIQASKGSEWEADGSLCEVFLTGSGVGSAGWCISFCNRNMLTGSPNLGPNPANTSVAVPQSESGCQDGWSSPSQGCCIGIGSFLG